MFHEVIERTSEFFKIGFFVIVYNLADKDVTYVSSAGPADLLHLEEATAKIKFFLTKEERWRNFNQDCRGTLRCGQDLWVVASNDSRLDEAICAYLVLRLANIRTTAEWVTLVRSARTNKNFIRLNEAFIRSGHQTVLYRKS